MKKSITLFFLFCGLFFSNLNAQEILYFDFGDPAYPTTGNWNNITTALSMDPYSLINSDGTTTAYSLTITDDFFSGSNTSGTATPAGDAAANFTETATRDNIFGFGLVWGTTPANTSGAFTITGLDPAKYYTLTFFGSRTPASDNREALYTVSGATADIAVALDAANNTSNVITAYNAQPTSVGALSVKVEAGPNNNNSSKFYYLGAMKMKITSTPETTSLNDIKQNLSVFYADGVMSLADFTGEVNVYTTTGKLAAKGTAVLGYFKVDIEKGIYIVKAGNSTSKLFVK